MRDWNTHHLVYPKSSYRSSVEKAYREHKSLKVKMYIPPHNALHADPELWQPPKPSKQQMLGALSLLDDNKGLDPLDNMVMMAEYYGDFRHDKKAQRLGESILKQLGYVSEGLYVPERYDVV